MYILNKKSELIQECDNSDVVRICKNDVENFAISDDWSDLENMIDVNIDLINYNKMSVPNLKELAKEKGIQNYSTMNKEALIEAVKTYD